MTNSQKVSYILEKYKETQFSRSTFFWRWIEEFVVESPAVYITRSQFDAFWKDFASTERILRDKLKGKLKPEVDSKRYEKAEEFRERFKDIPEDELKDFNTAFGD